MANKSLFGCNAKFTSVGLDAIEKNTTIAFTRKRSNDNTCDILPFSDFVADAGSVAVYDRKDKPDIESCLIEQCDLYGSVTVTGTSPVSGLTNFKVDGEDYQFGYLRFRVYVEGVTTATFKVSDGGTIPATNSNDYTKSLTAGWSEIVIDLSDPDTVTGSGWVGSASGVNLSVNIPFTSAKLSTIEFIKNIEGLSSSFTLMVDCIASFTGDITLASSTGQCIVPNYAKDQTAISKTLAHAKWVGNMMRLNPLASVGDKTNVDVSLLKDFKFTSETLSGITYASVTIPDMSTSSKCLDLIVQPKPCVTDTLTALEITDPIEISDLYFFTIGNKLYANEDYIGKEVTVRYPVNKKAKQFILSNDVLNDSVFEARIQTHQSGKDYLIVHNNISFTSFPDLPLGNADNVQTSNITYTVLPDSNGYYGDVFELDKE